MAHCFGAVIVPISPRPFSFRVCVHVCPADPPGSYSTIVLQTVRHFAFQFNVLCSQSWKKRVVLALTVSLVGV